MNSRSIISFTLLATLFATNLFIDAKNKKKPKDSKSSNASKVEKAPESQLPDLVIKTIRNTTPYDILLIDRLPKDKSIILPAGKIVEVDFVANSQNAVVINGNMADVMEQKAQYAFKKLARNGAPELNQEVYFNLHMAGTNESCAFNFYVAGKNGGCSLISRRFSFDENLIVEFELTLSMSEENIRANVFKMNVDGSFACKQK